MFLEELVPSVTALASHVSVPTSPSICPTETGAIASRVVLPHTLPHPWGPLEYGTASRIDDKEAHFSFTNTKKKNRKRNLFSLRKHTQPIH